MTLAAGPAAVKTMGPLPRPHVVCSYRLTSDGERPVLGRELERIASLPEEENVAAYAILAERLNDLTWDELIEFANAIKSPLPRESTVWRPAAELHNLAREFEDRSVLVDALMKTFYMSHRETVASWQVTRIIRMTRDLDQRDRILLDHVHHRKESMALITVLDLTGESVSLETTDAMLSIYAEATPTLSPVGLQSILSRIANFDIRNRLVQSFFDRLLATGESLPTAEVITLVKELYSLKIRDRILYEYARRRRSNLSAADLSDLARAAYSDSVEGMIEDLEPSRSTQPTTPW